jgi:copper chaperone CopZ
MFSRQHLLPILGLSLLMACSSTPDPASVATDMASAGIERAVKEVAISNGDPVTTADLRIEGMSCEMMCGGSIKKALAALPGVGATEVRFNEGEEADHVVVTYNENEVTDAQMVEAIQALYDGQYKVSGITITRQVKGTASEEDTSGPETVEDGKVNVYAPAAALLPSVFTLLSRILGE